MTAPRFGLIVFGDELLSGKRQDAHAPKFIELLAARGAELDWARYVRDERAAQASALRAAAASGDAVLCCGGIGATPPARKAAPAQGGPLEPANRAPVAIERFQTPTDTVGERLRDA